jgi:beta-glucosidase
VETARKSIVLLKNEGHTLPLRKSLKTIAVIGPNADDAGVMVGNYNGDPTAPVTPLAGIRRKLANTKVLYSHGSDLAANMPSFEVVPASALSGLMGEYYNSANFDGKNHRPRELTYPNSGQNVGGIPQDLKPLFTRADATIDFRWWDGSPRADLKDDDFGIRWTGKLSAPVSGKYQLGAIGMNAFELYLDDQLIARFNNIHERSYQYKEVQLEAGKSYALRLDYHEFVNDADIQLVWSREHATQSSDVDSVVKQADAVVLVLGLSPRLEGEEMKVPVEGFKGGDRVDLGIPRAQEELMQKVVASGKPVVLVLLNGSAVAINWAREHVPAIVELWYPGQAGGTALADVLFGDYNPAGRLPVTFYKSAGQLPPFTDYNMKGRTYRYFTGEPLFPFGYGLSYTTFAYRNLKLPKQSKPGGEVKVTVDVQNTGKMAGEEVVQLYLRNSGAPEGSPIRSLEGFNRISLTPGERKSVQFVLPGKIMASPGSYEIAVGGKQPGFHGAADSPTTGTVTGTIRVIQ